MTHSAYAFCLRKTYLKSHFAYSPKFIGGIDHLSQGCIYDIKLNTSPMTFYW